MTAHPVDTLIITNPDGSLVILDVRSGPDGIPVVAVGLPRGAKARVSRGSPDGPAAYFDDRRTGRPLRASARRADARAGSVPLHCPMLRRAGKGGPP